MSRRRQGQGRRERRDLLTHGQEQQYPEEAQEAHRSHRRRPEVKEGDWRGEAQQEGETVERGQRQGAKPEDWKEEAHPANLEERKKER